MRALLVTVSESGHVAFEIPDAQGELVAYDLLVLSVRPWKCRLTRLDTGAERLVEELATPGRYRCSCEDRTYKGYRKRDRPDCKHVLAAPGLRALARLLHQPAADAPPPNVPEECPYEI